VNKTQFIKELQDDLNLPRREVVQILNVIEEAVVKGLKQDGVAVLGNVARFTRKTTPARPAGEYPGFGGEMKHYPHRPAQTKVRVAVPKVMKDRLA
jgi:nucleoid DNA-binding protein